MQQLEKLKLELQKTSTQVNIPLKTRIKINRALVLVCSKSGGRNFAVSNTYSKYTKFRRFDGDAVRKAGPRGPLIKWIYIAVAINI